MYWQLFVLHLHVMWINYEFSAYLTDVPTVE